MSEPQKQQNKMKNNESEEQEIQQGQNKQQQPQNEQLSQADRQTYDKIFKSISKIDKKVQNARSKLNKDSEKIKKNANFKEIAEKLIESKQNSDITTKEDLMADVHQSFERAVVDIYSENQRLKKKMQGMEKTIHQQNHKLFQHRDKEQRLNKQIQKLRFQLAQAKDGNTIQNRGPKQLQNSNVKKQTQKKNHLKTQNQQNEDFDFWNTPQDGGYGKKKKEFVQNSGLWVNQQQTSNNSGMFVTESRR